MRDSIVRSQDLVTKHPDAATAYHDMDQINEEQNVMAMTFVVKRQRLGKTSYQSVFHRSTHNRLVNFCYFESQQDMHSVPRTRILKNTNYQQGLAQW
jgi:hypothetical protein